jgi:hypothetical protein
MIVIYTMGNKLCSDQRHLPLSRHPKQNKDRITLIFMIWAGTGVEVAL